MKTNVTKRFLFTSMLIIVASSTSVCVAAAESDVRKPANEKASTVEGLLSVPTADIPLCPPRSEIQPTEPPFPNARTQIIMDGKVVD